VGEGKRRLASSTGLPRVQEHEPTPSPAGKGERRERPILFSAPMVRALLDGRKTQTRRVVKPQPTPEVVDAGVISSGNPAANGVWSWLDSKELEWASTVGDDFRCPYGVPGDVLWVREAWTPVPASAYRMSEGVQQTVNPSDPYMAAIYAAGWDRSIPKWKPSIHMPRWASRLTLKITDVRVERLNDISEADALAEGLVEYDPTDEDPAEFAWDDERGRGEVFNNAVSAYRDLWNHINDPGSWAANPWVWAVSFEVVGSANGASPAGSQLGLKRNS
jgi:hypothetical protein